MVARRLIAEESCMVTQQEVAKKAGVSFITVSRVINGKEYVKKETREKVLQTIKELNYYPNQIGRALHIKSVNIIGIITPTPANVAVHETDYYNSLMAGIEKSTIVHNYDLLLSAHRNEDHFADYLRLYFQRKVDGLILITPDLNNPQIKVIQAKNIPCVVIGDRPATNTIDYVDTDNYDGMYRVAEYLIGKGHRQIAYVKGDKTSPNARDRFKGFNDALKKNGLKVVDNWVFEGDFTPESGRNALKKILDSGQLPTALICANDLMALGALSEAKAAHIKIPEDLALIGFDGIAITAFTDPPLSTVRQPLFEMGFTATEMLFNKIKEPERSSEYKIFPVDIVEGKST